MGQPGTSRRHERGAVSGYESQWRGVRLLPDAECFVRGHKLLANYELHNDRLEWRVVRRRCPTESNRICRRETKWRESSGSEIMRSGPDRYGSEQRRFHLRRLYRRQIRLQDERKIRLTRQGDPARSYIPRQPEWRV